MLDGLITGLNRFESAVSDLRLAVGRNAWILRLAIGGQGSEIADWRMEGFCNENRHPRCRTKINLATVSPDWIKWRFLQFLQNIDG